MSTKVLFKNLFTTHCTLNLNTLGTTVPTKTSSLLLLYTQCKYKCTCFVYLVTKPFALLPLCKALLPGQLGIEIPYGCLLPLIPWPCSKVQETSKQLTVPPVYMAKVQVQATKNVQKENTHHITLAREKLEVNCQWFLAIAMSTPANEKQDLSALGRWNSLKISPVIVLAHALKLH